MSSAATRAILLDRAYIENEISANLEHYGAAGNTLTDLLVDTLPGARFAYGKRRDRTMSWVSIGDPYDPMSLVLDWASWYWDRPGDGPVGFCDHLAFSPYIPQGGTFQSVDWLDAQVSGEARLRVEPTDGMADETRDWLEAAGERSTAWWMLLWADGMLGWPSREVMEAFMDQHPYHVVLIPWPVKRMVLG